MSVVCLAKIGGGPSFVGSQTPLDLYNSYQESFVPLGYCSARRPFQYTYDVKHHIVFSYM